MDELDLVLDGLGDDAKTPSEPKEDHEDLALDALDEFHTSARPQDRLEALRLLVRLMK